MFYDSDHVFHVHMNRDYPSITKAEGIYLYDAFASGVSDITGTLTVGKYADTLTCDAIKN